MKTTMILLVTISLVAVLFLASPALAELSRTDAQMMLAYIQAIQSNYDGINSNGGADRHFTGPEQVLWAWSNPHTWLTDPIEEVMRKMPVLKMLMENLQDRILARPVNWSEQTLQDVAYGRTQAPPMER